MFKCDYLFKKVCTQGLHWAWWIFVDPVIQGLGSIDVNDKSFILAQPIEQDSLENVEKSNKEAI